MKIFRNCLVFVLIGFICLCAHAKKKDVNKPERVSEAERKVLNDKYDKLKLREKTDFVEDTSASFLVEPLDDPNYLPVVKDFIVAKVPPKIKMMIVPDMDPEYFPETTVGGPVWANWGKLTRSEDNRFFFSVGDHRGFGSQLSIYEYSPARNVLEKVVDVDELLGWTEKSYADGKIHGRMGIMPDGTLWAATHYGVYPDESWWENGYRGSWLLSYNINTRELKNWGVPLIGNMLPEFKVDTKRGRFFGTGAKFTCLCFDTNNKKVRFAGYPPNGWIWWRRACLLDEKTGKFWSTDRSDNKHRLLSFDPELNRFERYEISMPINPVKGEISALRNYTEQRAMDGAFYCMTGVGAMFKFWPEKPAIEYIGLNWDKGRYSSTAALDPSGRYIYYIPGGLSGGNATENGPIVQYDVKTGRKKVIAWLVDYYYKKYGYRVGGTYGMEISNDGAYLVIVMNGAFQGREVRYGHPSLFVVELPEDERTTD